MSLRLFLSVGICLLILWTVAARLVGGAGRVEPFDAPAVPRAVRAGAAPGVLSLASGGAPANQTQKAAGERQSVLARKLALPIVHYCFKSSFSSCYNGADVDLHMLRYVIARGCRVLDFEVFAADSIAQVGFSSQAAAPGAVPANEAAARVPLDSALSAAVQAAFSHSGCPNPADPLFVHLRLRAGPTDLAFLSTVARAVEANLKGNLFPSPVEVGRTTVGEIMGKIVLMVNVVGAPNFATSDLGKYVNVETGNSAAAVVPASALAAKPATAPTARGGGLETTAARLVLTTPDTSYLSGWMTAADYESALLKPHGVQMHLAPFYRNDKALGAYEGFFRTAGAALIPMASVL